MVIWHINIVNYFFFSRSVQSFVLHSLHSMFRSFGGGLPRFLYTLFSHSQPVKGCVAAVCPWIIVSFSSFCFRLVFWRFLLCTALGYCTVLWVAWMSYFGGGRSTVSTAQNQGKGFGAPQLMRASSCKSQGEEAFNISATKWRGPKMAQFWDRIDLTKVDN